MNFTMPPADKLKKQIAFWLSEGVFCLFLAGCALRDSELPVTETPKADFRPAAIEFVEEEVKEKPPKPEKPDFHKEPPVSDNGFRHHERDPQFETVPHDLPISSEAMEWVSIYENRFGEGSADAVILDAEQIRTYNERLIEECPALYDMTKVPAYLSGQSVADSISRYAFPAGEKYDRSGKPIDEERRTRILENCNLGVIPEEVIPRRGVITSRCDLKAFPTEIGFYDSGDTYYSRIQETELITGFPVWILHNSADGRFLFVQSYYYAGWIETQSAAYCDEETYRMFASPESFVTVTLPHVLSDGVRLDMGAVLPYLSETETDYIIQLPVREADGFAAYTEFSVSKTDAVYGFLPYTMKNYYTMAFSFLGASYGWGGADGGVDCSGFVCSVFRTFGLYLPRNTGEQSQYSGEVKNLALPTAEESTAVLRSVDTPATVHRKGHVMLYLGSTGGKYYVIHAPRGGDQVSVAAIALPGSYTCAVQIH